MSTGSYFELMARTLDVLILELTTLWMEKCSTHVLHGFPESSRMNSQLQCGSGFNKTISVAYVIPQSHISQP